MQNSTTALLDTFRRAHEEADALFELAAKRDLHLAVAIAHRLSSSIEAMRLAVESSAIAAAALARIKGQNDLSRF